MHPASQPQREQTPKKQPFNQVYSQLINSAHSPHRSFHLQRKGIDTEVVIIKNSTKKVKKLQMVTLIEGNNRKSNTRMTQIDNQKYPDNKIKEIQFKKLQEQQLRLKAKLQELRSIQVKANQIRENMYEIRQSQERMEASRSINLMNIRADYRESIHSSKRVIEQLMNLRFQEEKSIFGINPIKAQIEAKMGQLIRQGVERERKGQEILNNIRDYIEKIEEVKSQRIKEQAIYALEQKQLRIKQEENMLTSFQLSVLKLQITPNLRISFESLSPQTASISSCQFFSKDKLLWPQSKVKRMSLEQTKYHMVLQLYPGWKKWMQRLSFNFDGYKTLLFFKNSQSMEQKSYDLQQLMQLKKVNRTSSNKRKQLLVYYSPIPQRFAAFLEQLSQKLKNLHNNILKVNSVVINPAQTELIINYLYLGSEEKSKKWQIIKLQELTRDSLGKYVIGGRDRVVTAKIQIPVLLDKFELSKYEQVYDLIRKEK